MSKVTIIGAGSVGSTIAYTMVVNGIASEIVMIDVNEEKALGEAMDIRQGTPFCSPVSIYAGSYRDAVGSDIVIITSGVARKPGQTRIDLAQTNVGIIKSIAPQITKYAPNAVYILVANPVDILTYVFTKISGLPERQVIGSGTILDTARLRARLSEYLRISQKNVHAYVMGEHGDSEFSPISQMLLGTKRISELLEDKCNGYCTEDLKKIEEQVRTAAYKIIEAKNATYYGIGMAITRIVKAILGDENSVLTVSAKLCGEYDSKNVFIGVPCIIGRNGVKEIIELSLTDEEMESFKNSVEVLEQSFEGVI
jgi:L-lactate dehydrogenase